MGGRVFTNYLSFTHPTPDVWAGVRQVTGTTDTIAAGDLFSLVTYDNPNPVAVALPGGLSAMPTSSYVTGGVVSFFKGWFACVKNLGAGPVTITPQGCPINGGPNIVLAQNKGAIIFNVGGSYQALLSQ